MAEENINSADVDGDLTGHQVKNEPLPDDGSAPQDYGVANSHIDYSLLLDTRTPIPTLSSVPNRIKAYHAMMTNSTISGILLAFKALCLTAKYSIAESTTDPDRERAKRRAEFLQSCIDDMQVPFMDAISEILEMIPYGFQIMVPQFKLRAGYNQQSALSSQYFDGKIGWKNWLPIDPRTISRWNTPQGGGYFQLTGISQRVSFLAPEVHIPRNRMLLFRTTSSNNDPTGKSLLYGAYKDWVKLEEANEIQMVGLKRCLEGVPYGRVHSKLLADAKTNPSSKSAVNAVKKAVTDFDNRVDRGFILPADTDEQGKYLTEVKIMGSNEGGGNSKIQDSKIIIDSKEQAIARSMLAQFMTISNKGGSYALSKNNTEVFINSLKSYMDQIAGVMNLEAIPTLFLANGEGGTKDDHYYPKIVFSEFIKEDINEFMSGIDKAISSGIFTVTTQIQDKVGKLLNIDTAGQKEALEKRQQEEEEMKQRMLESSQNPEEDATDAEDDDVANVANQDDPDTPTTTSDDVTDPELSNILNGDG